MPCTASLQQCVVCRQRFGRGVNPIGKQGKMKSCPRNSQGNEFRVVRPILRFRDARVSSIGITTMVRKCSGMPMRRSSRGSERGPSQSVTTRLISAMARSEAGKTASNPKKKRVSPRHAGGAVVQKRQRHDGRGHQRDRPEIARQARCACKSAEDGASMASR